MAEQKPLIFGLLGFPVKHSFSPAMHNAALRYLKIDAQYRLFEIKPEDLQDFLLLPEKKFADTNGNIINAGDVIGFNITIPHKVEAWQILGKEIPLGWSSSDRFFVELSGAINTAIREKNKISYYNTDAVGFLESLRKDLDFYYKDKTILLLGCGGAARAIIAGLCWGGGVAKIYATDISKDAIQSTKEHFLSINRPSISTKLEFISIKDIPAVIRNCQLLINATPVGMKEGDDSVIDKKLLPQDTGLNVYDIVYNRKTKLIQDAESLGLKYADGLGMLLYQGVESFKYFTEKVRQIWPQIAIKERDSIVNIMHQALKEEIAKCRRS